MKQKILHENSILLKNKQILRFGKVILCLLILSIAISSCKNQTKKKTESGTSSNANQTTNIKHARTEKHAVHGNGSQNSSTHQVIRESMKKNGFLSASIFQVFITVLGSNEAEVRRIGFTQGLHKALNIIRHLPALKNKRLRSSAMRALRNELRANAKIVAIHRKDSGAWDVVLRIERENLKIYLKTLR